MKRMSFCFLVVLLLAVLLSCDGIVDKELWKTQKTVIFVFRDYSTQTPTVTTYTKTFTADKWSEVLKNDETITFGTTETTTYNMHYDTGDGDNVWTFYIDPELIWFNLYIDISNPSDVIKLKSDDEITNGMTIYCIYVG